MKAQELQDAIELSRPVIINGTEYAEISMVRDMCDKLPFVQAPIFEMIDYNENNNRNNVVYMSFNEKMIARSRFNVPAVACAVCNLCTVDTNNHFRCSSAPKESGQKLGHGYLKGFVTLVKLTERVK